MPEHVDSTRTTWLDAVYARPAVGITMAPLFRFPHEVASLFSPMIQRLTERGQVVQCQLDGNSFRLTTADMAALVSPTDVVVEYVDSPTLEHRSGRPSLKFGTDEPILYSRMCTELLKFGNSITDAAHGARTRGLQRVGVVASCVLDRNNLPPGGERLIRHITQPWGAAPITCQLQLTVPTGIARGDTQDRCHHFIDLNAGTEGSAVVLRLDWQREFRVDRAFSTREYLPLIEQCLEDALTYFERFGGGDLEFVS